MSNQIFLIIALVTTGVFLVQFVLSIFFGDMNTDTDANADADMGSIVSFKGLTHFGIGFGWFMYLQPEITLMSYAVGFAMGIVFVFAVWFLYKKAYQLQQTTKTEQREQLVGRECSIYFKHGNGKYTVQIKYNGALREVDVYSESDKSYQTGDKVIIAGYKEGTLIIQ